MRIRLIIAMTICLVLAGCTLIAPSTTTAGEPPAASAPVESPTPSSQPEPTATTTVPDPPPSSEPPPTREAPPTTEAPKPPETLDNAVLDTSGLGPIKLGMTWDQLKRNGWLQVSPYCPPAWVTGKQLQSRGVDLLQDSNDRLIDISLGTPHYATRSGARVGMTYGQLQQLYGSKLELESKEGYQGAFQVATVRDGGREIIFADDTGKLTANSRIRAIHARNYSRHYMYDGC